MAGASWAQGNEPARVDPRLIEELAEWIEAHTRYDAGTIASDPPTIRFIDVGDDLETNGRIVRIQPQMRGAYEGSSHTIMLVRPWNPDEPLHRSALLHELVHHIQHVADVWECQRQTEWEAYRLQDIYLAEQGIAAHFDWLAIRMFSRCDPDEDW